MNSDCHVFLLSKVAISKILKVFLLGVAMGLFVSCHQNPEKHLNGMKEMTQVLHRCGGAGADTGKWAKEDNAWSAIVPPSPS